MSSSDLWEDTRDYYNLGMHKGNFFLLGPVGNIKDEGESKFCIWAIILHFVL